MTTKSTWRDTCAPIIARVLAETKDQPEEKIKKALFEAYPFGEREHFPYKVWLDEIQNQRHAKKQPTPVDQPALF